MASSRNNKMGSNPRRAQHGFKKSDKHYRAEAEALKRHPPRH